MSVFLVNHRFAGNAFRVLLGGIFSPRHILAASHGKFHYEIGLESLGPVVADPVFHTPPAPGQTAEASPCSLSGSHPTWKRKLPNRLPGLGTTGRENDRLSPESFLEPSGQCFVFVLTYLHRLTIREEHGGANPVSVLRYPAYLRVRLRKDHLDIILLNDLVKV